VSVAGLQTGALVPQSAFDRHATHAPAPMSHRGAFAGQSEFASHATHWLVLVSQIFAVPVQSVALLQPTHAPPVVLQIGAVLGHAALLAHAGWQSWSDDQHAGVVPLQSAFDAHVTHAPCRQCDAAAGQFASAVHSTQPSVGLHCSFMSHWLVPLTPQTALPPPGPPSPPVTVVVVLPFAPHAIARQTRAAAEGASQEIRRFIATV